VTALDGVRVLDLTRFLAGPFCTAILADLGAEVIKVEAPRGGDEGRYGYPTADGVPVAFLALNRNKKGITLDVRQPEGRALVRRLLSHVDVLAENFAGGTLAAWGLVPADLVREHPRLVVASMSGFGQTGPWATRPSYDIVAQAAGGLMSLTGFPDTPPTRGGGSLGEAGSVAWNFESRGIILAQAREKADPEDLALQAIDAGADDFNVEGEEVEILTEPTQIDEVRKALEAAGAMINSAEVSMVPKTQIDLPVDQTTAVMRLVERLEDLDDVTRVYTNIHISDEVLAQAAAS